MSQSFLDGVPVFYGIWLPRCVDWLFGKGMVVFCQLLCDISRHGDVEVFLVVMPVEGDSTVQTACVINLDVVVPFYLDEMV